jgi:phenylalanyl-tRNA synthetase beta chain
MTNIAFNKKALEKQLNKKISDKLLLERVPFLGTPIENMTSEEITIEVNPNRPDFLSLPGFSRALSSFLGFKTGLKIYKAQKSNYAVHIDESVNKVRPFTVCAVVKGITFTDEKIKEVIDLQEKLHITYGRNRKKMALGIYPLEKIKFPITYTALSPEQIKFKPLEFDKALDASQILALHPTGKKYGHLLDGNKKYPVFVDANKNIMSMPPIINSDNVGKISKTTKDVFIECSGFDFAYLSKALNMVVCALSDMQGTIYEVTLQYEKKKITPELHPESMELDMNYVNKIIGVALKPEEIKKMLAKMGYGMEKNKVLIPCYRADIMHPIDLIEDIAIAYGYENIPLVIPTVASTGKEDDFESFKNKIRDILIGAGLLEVKNFALSNLLSQNKKVMEDKKTVELESAFSEDYNVLRRHILPSIMETLQRNKHREYPQNIFEIGIVFQAKSEIVENDRLGIALCHTDADFTKIKQILVVLMQELALSYTMSNVSKEEFPSFIQGRIGSVKVNNEQIAHLGEISPEVLERFEMEMPVAYLELNLEKLYNAIKK